MSRRILVAFDGTAPARVALERAAAIVGDGELLLLHVLPEIVTDGLTPTDVAAEETAAEAAELEAEQSRLAAAGIAVRALPIAGDAFADAAEAIVEQAAAEAATLIVIGTRGEGAFGRFAHGSVSTRVAHEARCDVLIVRRS